ncbi:hypothetical protein [Paenibacillus aestuarii]|uniref:YtkA-like domain-containing protein n=1 Tax=Paenibacillus aestuarii TaxID=516965 RepID=A0ABW0KD71_9BACL|nr:hypothetical protein [Paenibacillus aestuarii]
MKKVGLMLLAAVLLLSACGKAVQSPGHEGHQGGASEHAVDDTQAVFQTADGVKAKQDTQLNIQINGKDGKPIDQFDLNHEKKMHLIAVSKDLSYFRHLHPEYKGNGQFTITTQFPAGGEYRLFADYMPSGKAQTVKSYTLKVQGDVPQAAVLQPETAWTKTVGGSVVTLSFDHLMAGMDVNLNYMFKDAQTGSPIKDLQPYLGAVGHVVILDEAAEQYLHVHPTDEKSTGPEAVFKTTFPKSGKYKIWGEFQRGGKVITVPFVVKVP